MSSTARNLQKHTNVICLRLFIIGTLKVMEMNIIRRNKIA